MKQLFENTTPKVEEKLAVLSLAANKQRNFLTGIIIFAASLLLAFSTILLCNATIDTQMISRVNNTQNMIGVILSIAIVLLFTAGIAIKNIMYISVLQRTREFAQLRTIGATCRQIKAVIHNERKKLSWKYILCGLILGFLCNLVLPLKFYLAQSILCMVLSGVFVWFIVFWSFQTPAKLAALVSPISALKTEDSHLTRVSKKSIHITPRNLAKMYFFSNRKKATYTMISLILSGMLMFMVFSVISAIDIEKLVRQSYYENSSIYLMLNTTAEENATYELMKKSPFIEELNTTIENIPGVTAIHSSKKLDCEITVEDSKYDIALNSVVGTSSFETQLVEGSMPYFQSEINDIPVVVNRVSPYYEMTGLDLKLGDYFAMSIDTGKSMQEVEFSVCGFIENKDKGNVFYSDPKYLDFISDINCDLAWYICTEKEQTDFVVKEIETLLDSDSRLTVSVFSDELSEMQVYLHNAKIIITAITILICLFAFVNLLNTCITNTVMRQHDYALLEAAGMTKEQIKQMQGIENQTYFSGSLIGSLVMGIPMGFLLCSKIAELPGLSYITYRFPWTFVLFYILFVIVVRTIVTVYQKNILMEQSVVERIKMSE